MLCALSAVDAAPARGRTGLEVVVVVVGNRQRVEAVRLAGVAAVAKMSSVANAMCCTPEPKNSARKRPERVRWFCEPLSVEAQRAVGVLDHLAAHQAAGIDDVLTSGVFVRSKMRGVEQQPGQHLVVVHRLGDWSMGQAGAGVRAGLAGRVELDLPDARSSLFGSRK